MGYADIAALDQDQDWRSRVDACCYEQAATFINDGRSDIAALASAVLVGGATPYTLRRHISNAPGFADTYSASGQQDILDADLLAATQYVWPTVAAVLFPQG